MLFYWIGVYFFSALGMFMLPVYGAVEVPWWVLFLCAGTAAVAAGCYRSQNNEEAPHSTLLVYVVPLALGIAAFSFPYSMPLYVLCAGIILQSFVRKKYLTPACSALVLSGLVLLVQTACAVPYYKLASRYHEFHLLSPLVCRLLNMFGLTCTYSQETLFVQTPRSVVEIVTAWEKLGLYFLVVFFAGGVVLFFKRAYAAHPAQRCRQIAGLLLVVLLYGFVRYVFLCLLFVDIGTARIFWEPVIVAASFLPLPLITAALMRPGISYGQLLLPVSFGKIPMCAGAACFCVFFSLAVLCWFHDPGTKKQGRVLIDEYYSNWEWTYKKLDTDWYGVYSVYNYYNMAEHLKRFFDVDLLMEPLTPELLARHDVFMVKTPTRAFTQKEIDMIVQYVEDGGGLFLIGDHTNVYGTTININPLAKRFGITFNYDATYNLRTNDLHFHESSTLFRHPALLEMPYFLFATSCSMEVPLLADDVMTASNLKTIYLDYSRGGYFPDKKEENNFTFGLFLQTAGLRRGRGRVLAFTDSTCFSNFYMHIPGKPEYIVGTVEWLNRMNDWHRPVMLISALGALVSLALLILLRMAFLEALRVPGVRPTGLLLFWGAGGLAAGALLCTLIVKTAYSLPEAQEPAKTVGYESGHCHFAIPDKQLIHKDSIDYHTFYVWTQRLGYVPDLFTLEEDLKQFDVIVMVNPVKPFSETALNRIREYVTQGGRLLVLDHPLGKSKGFPDKTYRRSTANDLLSVFGMHIDHGRRGRKQNIFEDGQKVGVLPWCAPVDGGTPMLSGEAGQPLIAIADCGSGMVAAAACAPSFTVKHMGETENVPDKKQQFLYRLEFWLLRSLMKKEFKPFSEF